MTEDKLSGKERQEIGDKLGLTADRDGTDVFGHGAYLLLRVPDFGEPDFPNTADTLFPDQSYQPTAGEWGLSPTDTPPRAKRLQSFLRLGSFDINQEPASAKKLLMLMHQAGPPGNPVRGDNNAAFYAQGDGGPEAFDSTKHGFLDVPALHTRDDATKKADLAGNRDVFFIDDVRVRPQDVKDKDGNDLASLGTGDDPGHGLTMKQRQNESAKLYARGGWRDHSDGNRISTTYGDKVEVVRGNYKMIVMGRQDDPGEAMGWEATGSHIQDYAPGTMPGASYWLEWIPNYQESGTGTAARLPGSKGVWLLVNTTENVYEYARNAGHFREEKWGDLHETYVGSENPSAGQGVTQAEIDAATAAGTPLPGTKGHEPPHYLGDVEYHFPHYSEDKRHVPPWENDNMGIVRSNPHVVEKTWARRIDSWTGSSGCFVGAISEKKYANQIDEFTQCSGAITADTLAGAVNERALIGAKAESTITSSVAETLVTLGVLSTSVILGLEVETKLLRRALATTIVIGKETELKLAKTTTTIELLGKKSETSIFANKREVAIGRTLAANVGTSLTFTIGAHQEITIPEKEDTELKKLEQRIEKNEQAIKKNSTAVNNSWKVLKCNLKAGKLDLC